MDSWLFFFTLYSCSSSSLHAEKIALLCLDSYTSLHADEKDAMLSRADMLLRLSSTARRRTHHNPSSCIHGSCKMEQNAAADARACQQLV
jgi:hypothetical protein